MSGKPALLRSLAMPEKYSSIPFPEVMPTSKVPDVSPV
jgi:hypothetical protein